ncbi:MAG TPA: DUF3124 domain-containing protein [Parasulfuritortus sp.]
MKPNRLLRSGWLALCLAAPAAFADGPVLATGQALYLPIYSHIWYGDLNRQGYPIKSAASALVSIRNTDPKTPIRVLSARYYSTDGKLLKDYMSGPRNVPPMGTYELYVERKESAGGSGANFVIVWQSAVPANAPLVEALHVDVHGSRGATFITRAQPIALDK